jgi:putative peptide zinc metalloprotease protein
MPGNPVLPGDILIECSEPLLPSRIRVLSSKLEELQALYNSQILTDRVKAQITQEDMDHVQNELRDAQQRETELTVYSAAAGTFLVPHPQDLPGRFVHRGEVLGYVVEPAVFTVRVVVSQPEADSSGGVPARFQYGFRKKSSIVPAVLKREIPAATDQLPAKTLGQAGGARCR